MLKYCSGIKCCIFQHKTLLMVKETNECSRKLRGGSILRTFWYGTTRKANKPFIFKKARLMKRLATTNVSPTHFFFFNRIFKARLETGASYDFTNGWKISWLEERSLQTAAANKLGLI